RAEPRTTCGSRLGRAVSIPLGAGVKQEGEQMVSEGAELKFVRRPTADELDAYERLLVDAMAGRCDALRARGRGRGRVERRAADPRRPDAGPRVRPRDVGAGGSRRADRGCRRLALAGRLGRGTMMK